MRSSENADSRRHSMADTPLKTQSFLTHRSQIAKDPDPDLASTIASVELEMKMYKQYQEEKDPRKATDLHIQYLEAYFGGDFGALRDDCLKEVFKRKGDVALKIERFKARYVNAMVEVAAWNNTLEPTWPTDLPVTMDQIKQMRLSNDPWEILTGHYAASLEEEDFDSSVHPSRDEYACGMRADPRCHSHILYTPELMERFPADDSVKFYVTGLHPSENEPLIAITAAGLKRRRNSAPAKYRHLLGRYGLLQAETGWTPPPREE
jgi:hypothetical protein